MAVESRLREKQQWVTRELTAILADREKDPLACAILDAVLPEGKRLRPVLCLEACEWAGAEPRSIVRAACAIELIHKMSLVHDDLPAMDNADVRYGRPTLHKVHGEALAVLAGDALLVEAFRLLSSLEGVPADRVLRAVQRLCIAIGSNGLAGGQAVDVLARQGRLRATSLEELHAMKTGSLFEAALAVGAELAGASDGMVRAVAEFGSQLGIAFQICDDLLDAEEVTNGRDAPGETNYAERVGPLRAAKLAEGLLLDALAALESQAGGNISGFAGIAMKLIERCRARSLSLSHRVRDDATRANDERYQTQL